MKPPFRRLFTLLAPLLWLATTGPASAGDAFRVVVSIKPVHAIVASLMQGLDGPELLVDGNKTPYDFKPTQAQREAVKQADLVIWVGPELEGWMPPLLKQRPSREGDVELLSMPSLKILPARYRPDPNARDPYFWLDSRNAIIMADELARILADADPGRAHVYRRNWEKLHDDLRAIDRKLEYGYRGLKGGEALLYFDTLQYFEQAYALRIGTVLTSGPDTPVPAARLLKARADIDSGKYTCLLVEDAWFRKAHQLDLLNHNGKLHIGHLDSFGATLPAGPGLYQKLIARDTRVIEQCIGAGDAPLLKNLDTTAATRETDHFILMDHMGQPVSDTDMLGKYQLLYFGYTYCPDICPTSLQVISQALDLLGPKADKIQPYFITIDPERDTVAKMREYVHFFNKRLIGLTGSKEMIDRAAKKYKVLYEKVTEGIKDPSLYLMDHSASVYLVDPNGRFVTKFAHGITPQAMAKRLDEIVR